MFAVVLTGVGLAIAGVVVTLVLRGREGGGKREDTIAQAEPPAAAPAAQPAAPAPLPAAVADAAPPAAPPDAAPAVAPDPPALPPPTKAKSKEAAKERGKPARKEKDKDKEKSRVAAPAAAPAPSADALYREGTSLYLKGQLADAKKKYEAALAQNSRYPAAHRGLGFVYQRLGDRAKALKHLKRYLELAPGARDAAEVKKKIESLGG